MSFIPSQTFAQTIYEEIVNTQLTPVVQIDASNGIREDVVEFSSGGAATAEDSNYVLTTGTNSDAFVALLSRRIIKYRAGQGVSCRFSALFEANAADSAQAAGFFNDSEGFVFGYNGTEFGIGRFYGGESELQELQVTTAAAGSETASITVDGTAYSVPLTSGTVNHNAYEIAQSLSAQVPLYRFTSNQDTVTALDDLARPAGAFAFTSATAVATWTQIQSGVSATQEWIAQADWDNPPNWGFDPSKGNIFQINYYWGYGGVRFALGNPETRRVETVHTIIYVNTAQVPFIEEPSFRIGWAIQHYGNTTPLTVRGSDAASFTDGIVAIDERSRGLEVTEVALTRTPINLISIRNRIAYGSATNRITVYPEKVLVGGEHNKAIIFYVQIDTTFTGDMDYSYVDEKNSCVEFSMSGAQVNLDGRDLGAPVIRATNNVELDLKAIVQFLNPGETLTVAAALSSGSNGEADLSVYWLEDQ